MAFTYTLSPLLGLELGTGEKVDGRFGAATKNYTLVQKITFDGTQTNADVIPLGVVNGNDVFVSGNYWNDALTGLTDIDIGLYTLDGVAVDADFFVDGDSLATAQDTPFGDNAMSAAGVIAQGDRSTQLSDLSASIEAEKQYVLAATINAAGSASGVLEVKYEILRQN